MTLNNLAILIALILFILAALGVFPAVNLIAWGLYFFALGHLILPGNRNV